MDDKTIYYLLQVQYLKMFGREVTLKFNFNDDLFPMGWFASDNYEFKIKVLGEALKRKVTIMDTELYIDSIGKDSLTR